MKELSIQFEKLWDALSKKLPVEEVHKSDTPNFIIRVPKGKVRVRVGDYGSGVDNMFKRKRSDTFSDVVCISRHFVKKPIYTINVAYITKDCIFKLRTTNDHTCAIYNEKYHELEEKIRNNRCIANPEDYTIDKTISFVSAKELKPGDCIPFLEPTDELYDDFDGECLVTRNRDNGEITSKSYASDGVGVVDSVEVDENKDGMWVYDLEVSSGRHVYYANRILVHNSQFINIAPITQRKCREFGLAESTRFSALPDEAKQSIIKDAYHILDLVNANVEQLINTNCHTSQGKVLHYALEYIAAEGFYFKKKHYIVHKILSDDLPCDKFKYSGISVKKAEIPAEMKTFLKDIYESTMTQEWTEGDYVNSVNSAYRKFITLDWDKMSYYKKLRTPKVALSLTQSEKGAGAHARAANFYNGLIEELGLGGKYPVIGIGDEMRYSYILPTNVYGQDVIGFKDTFPDEFRSLFKPDYNKMFNKIFTKSLENYVNIMGYSTFDPTKAVEDATFDIF